MKSIIFPEEEEASLPWCPLKVCVTIRIPTAWVLLELSRSLCWHKAPAGCLAHRDFQRSVPKFDMQIQKCTHGDLCSHFYAHMHVETATNPSCGYSPALLLKRLRLVLVSSNSSPLWQLSGIKKKKLKVGFLFKSLFQIYQVKIVIRPPTCAHTSNPQLHCTFLLAP